MLAVCHVIGATPYAQRLGQASAGTRYLLVTIPRVYPHGKKARNLRAFLPFIRD